MKILGRFVQNVGVFLENICHFLSLVRQVIFNNIIKLEQGIHATIF